jgi:hypothetical protein
VISPVVIANRDPHNGESIMGIPNKPKAKKKPAAKTALTKTASKTRKPRAAKK